MADSRVMTVVGLGPGRWEDLTVAARDTLGAASLVICRTLRHPTVDALRAWRPDLRIESFDGLYESMPSFDDLYPEMARRLLARAGELPAGETLLYAVPGHPLMGEESVRILRLAAAEQGVQVDLVAGLSFVETVCAALDLNPLERDLQLIDATALMTIPGEAVMGALLPTKPALIAQMYNRRLASGVKLALSEVYPEEWEVTLVRSGGIPGQEVVRRVALYELDRDESADHLTTVYVPPLDPLAATRAPEGLRYIVMRLRAPDGCPWDREQTHQSLRRYVLEEAYEVAEAIDELDGTPERAEKLADELGDLLLQVYLHAEVANQEDSFHLGDVYQLVSEKLIRRHPHVFGDVRVSGAEHVVRNWETIKRAERAAKGEEVASESALRGIPKGAPALYQAAEMSKKAGKVGFRFPHDADAVAKVAEEARELAEAISAGKEAGATTPTDEQQVELGDLLFALATLSQRLGVAPETALERANTRFRRRFERMEALARQRETPLDALSPDAWLALWAEVKAAPRATSDA
ncbi:MAG: nucleoside triphosphate pyrophosphohydrolase [Chloroflexota bacterium]|nr:nucleoside triphosphate pyrophosphohydrolase [Chloroflexota bacterium]